MALNDINFNRNKSGLGAPLLDKDHISALLFYNNTKPSGFLSIGKIKVFSLEQAEDLGITEESSAHGVEWYHIRSFFQMNPKGELWVSYTDVPADPTSNDFAELEELQVFSGGEIRQAGVYYSVNAFDEGFVTAIQTKVAALQVLHMPLNVIFTADFKDADLGSLPDLRALVAPNVSVTIGQDGDAKGKALYLSKGVSISDLGAKLGAVSFAKVSDSISWVEKFPFVTDGFEFEVPSFSNGSQVNETSSNLIKNIDDKGYIFLIKLIGRSGTYSNDSYTSAATSNDLATIENGRTIDKAIRTARTLLLPKLGSPLFVNPDGTLSDDTIATFKSLADQALGQMETNAELSAFKTIINPSQNVVQTSELVITFELVPVAVARTIVVNVGFVPKLS